MINETSPQRWYALGLLSLILLLIIFVAIVPLVSTWLDYHEQKQDLSFRLQRAQNIVAKKDTVFERVESIKQQYQDQHYFSSHKTVSLASAELQKFIKKSIIEADGQLTSTQVLPSKTTDGFHRVTVKVRMTGDIETLRTILHEIESSTPVMTVDQIDIRPVRGKRNRKTRKIVSSNKLNVNFQIAVFMRAES